MLVVQWRILTTNTIPNAPVYWAFGFVFVVQLDFQCWKKCWSHRTNTSIKIFNQLIKYFLFPIPLPPKFKQYCNMWTISIRTKIKRIRKWILSYRVVHFFITSPILFIYIPACFDRMGGIHSATNFFTNDNGPFRHILSCFSMVKALQMVKPWLKIH